ncbi:MAG: hypothetical protein ACLP2Y_16250 [Limisphaerales bacterium]
MKKRADGLQQAARSCWCHISNNTQHNPRKPCAFRIFLAKKTELISDNYGNIMFCHYEAAEERWNLKCDPE